MAKYTIEDTTLKAIADEIRNKTSLTDALNLDQMVIDIASIPPLSIGSVPTYVQSEAERVAETVKELQSENTLSFIALSDVHIGSDTQSRNSALHASQAVNIIKKLIPIDFSVVLGDIVTGGSTDSLEQHLDNHMQFKRTLSMTQPVVLDGNHDANIYNADSYITAGELYKYQGRHNIDVVKPTTETERNYFYFDIESKKTRVICLNSADLKGKTAAYGNDGHHISAAQYQWLVSVLDMTGKTDWKIIVLSHHPIHWYGYMPNVQTVLNAYIMGASGSFTVDSTSVSYNFSGKNAAKLVGTFHGHTHNFINGKVGDNEIIRMGTPNACYGRNNEYGSSSYSEDFRSKYGETTTYSKTANSAKDTAFVVNVIDFDNQTINSICYGAGRDRTLSYAERKSYIVTLNLSYVDCSNASLLVYEDDVYNNHLTANEGYELKSVVVTMGGVDVTSSVYTNGDIKISGGITGDIVVTAVAEMPVKYTNLVPTSKNTDGTVYNTTGYKEGYRLNSSGTETQYANAVCSGFIPYNLEVIRAYGTTNGNVKSTGFYIGLYDANFTKIYVAPGQISSTDTMIESINDKYQWKLDPDKLTESNQQTYFAQAKYIRVSLPDCSGADFVVTLNDDLLIDEENQELPYTNWLHTSTDENGNVFNDCGYETGKRFNSSGSTTADTNYAITGYIPAVQGDVLRLSSTLWLDTHESYMQIKLYDTSKTAVYVGYLPMRSIIDEGYAEYSTDSNGNHVIKLNTTTSSTYLDYYKKTAYIRLSVMANACADGVITVNEEIV